jgi:hypothetical protein
VYPGHDYKGRLSSTIGYERLNNSRLGQNRSREDFIELMNNLNLPYQNKSIKHFLLIRLAAQFHNYKVAIWNLNELIKIFMLLADYCRRYCKIADQGIKTLICNRPDGEGADQPNVIEIEEAAQQWPKRNLSACYQWQNYRSTSYRV